MWRVPISDPDIESSASSLSCSSLALCNVWQVLQSLICICKTGLTPYSSCTLNFHLLEKYWGEVMFGKWVGE